MRHRALPALLVAAALLVASISDGQVGPFISLSAEDTPLSTLLQQIADESGLAVQYEADALAGRTVTIDLDEVLVTSALKLVCQAADCNVAQEGDRWAVEPRAEVEAVAAAHEMMQRGDYEGVVEALGEWLRTSPDDVAALFAMIELQCALDQFAEAETLIARLRGLELEDTKQLVALDVLDGRVKAGRREFQNAFAAYAAALGKDPDCLDAYVERAKLYEMQGKYEQAAADWNAYLERAANTPMAAVILSGRVLVEDKLVREDGNSPTWSPDGQEIAYVVRSGTSQQYEIRAMDAETGADRLLFAGDGSFKWCLDWSPDGRYIAWEVRRRKPDSGERLIAVEVLDLEKNEVEMIERPYSVYYPRWCPDGQEILSFALDDPRFLATIPFGIDEPRLQFEPLMGATYAYADWSTDGRYIISSWNQLVGENYSLYLIDTEDPLAPHRQLMQHDASCRIRATYSPDGRLVAYLRSFEQYIYALYVMPADGTGDGLPVTFVRERNDGILGFGWAPDSRRIAYGTWDSRLHILRLGGLIGGEQEP